MCKNCGRFRERLQSEGIHECTENYLQACICGGNKVADLGDLECQAPYTEDEMMRNYYSALFKIDT